MDTVRIFSIDRAAVLEAARAHARVLSRRPEVEEVRLAGSFAAADGRWGPGSDADLIVVLSASDLPPRERIPVYLPRRFPVGVDLFPFTREEIGRRRARGDRFLGRLLEESIPLHSG